jgi:hypothetical protein
MRSTSLVVAILGGALLLGGAGLLGHGVLAERRHEAARQPAALCEAMAFAARRGGRTPEPCPGLPKLPPEWHETAGYVGLGVGAALLALGLAMRRDATRPHS